MNQNHKELREDAVAILLAQPDVNLIIEKIYSTLKEEQLSLYNFYITNLSGEKSEFINGSIRPISSSPRQEEVCLFFTRLLDEFLTDISVSYLACGSMTAFTRNCYRPDISFYNKKKTSFFDNLPVLPPPNLIIEVLNPFSESVDRILKLNDYQAHQVEEYWIADPEKQTIEQYHLVGEEYVLVLKSSQGFVESFVVKDFKMPIIAFFNEAENLKAFQSLL
jgi:Uma2 family endonuclease